jgi:hypothetical protein
MKGTFSYAEYRDIVDRIRSYTKILDYSEISKETKEFCIIRHDVEFSVDRALNMARFENEELGLSSSYFFQLRNNAYNLLSQTNIDKILSIKAMGHRIGLHVHLGGLKTREELNEYIKHDIDTVGHYMGIGIDRFSYHRPMRTLLGENLEIEGYINAYSDMYFHYFGDERPKKLNITYISDSNNLWRYGYPTEIIEKRVKRSQILIHPYSWTEEGYGETNDNFRNLVKEKSIEMVHTLNDELKNFSEGMVSDYEVRINDLWGKGNEQDDNRTSDGK